MSGARAAELEDARQVLRKARQAVIAAGNHDLFRAGIALDRAAVIEHFGAGLDEQEIARRGDVRNVEIPPRPQVFLGQRVGFAGMEVLLRPEIAAQADVRVDRGIDQDHARAVLFRHVGGVEAAERRTDETGAGKCFDGADRFSRMRRQIRACVLRAEAALFQIASQDLRLVRLRRGVEAVQVDDHFSRPSSFSWMPPKPPFDITSTWSPARASAVTSLTSRSRSSMQRAFLPIGPNTAAVSQPRPAV